MISSSHQKPWSHAIPEAGETDRKNVSFTTFTVLCKSKISFLAALSSATGAILAAGAITPEMLIPMAGVFFLACGAGALNQYQDRHIDACIARTQGRPLPAGQVNARQVLALAALLGAAGFSVLSLHHNGTLLAMGLFALIWYNIVYACLKRVTAFAAVPGAVVGAVPPAMGWVGGGGSIYDMALLPLCFFFMMWQIPHFWLLHFSHAQDYERVRLPVLVTRFSTDQIARILFIWLTATAVASLFMLLPGIITSARAAALMICAGLWLLWSSMQQLNSPDMSAAYASLFKRINLYMVFIMAILNGGILFNL